MMFSIYHFFASLVQNKTAFKPVARLEDFPFESDMLSCRNTGIFPDMAIRLNSGDADFTGGELIELKDSQSYSIPSFNSTIPTGKKDLSVLSSSGQLFLQMQANGDDVFSLPVRDVFYLVRGRRAGAMKICLIHGSFFETVKAETLIQEAFSQVLEERLHGSDLEIAEELKALLLALFSDQQSFSRVRNVEKASVKLRFRIMTEAKAEGNILNPTKYPQIEGDTLNLILPCHDSEAEKIVQQRCQQAFSQTGQSVPDSFRVRHHLNGEYLVFQTGL
jgi:hypothetical protein